LATRVDFFTIFFTIRIFEKNTPETQYFNYGFI